MTLDGDTHHDTIGHMLADTARHRPRTHLAALAWLAGAAALALWLTNQRAWGLWLGCYAVWVYAVWGLIFARGAHRHGTMHAIEILLVATGIDAVIWAAILAFYTLLGPRWVL